MEINSFIEKLGDMLYLLDSTENDYYYPDPDYNDKEEIDIIETLKEIIEDKIKEKKQKREND